MRVSFSISTNKPTYWHRFCEAISHNNVELEVVFVGICDGHEGMKFPVPTKFVQTPVNPAQCWEAGTRIATGDIICIAADDFIFTPGVVDDAVKALANTNNMYDVASAKYWYNDQDYYFGMYMFSQMHMPLLPMGGFALAESHRNIGGIDKRFKCVVWDTDLYMRFCEAGGHTILMENHKYHEKGGLNGLYARNEHIDVPTLRSFWTRNGKLSTNRTCPPIPFDDKDILTVNQCER
jgi:hypothetical protein